LKGFPFSLTKNSCSLSS